jgi:hypothetical protein
MSFDQPSFALGTVRVSAICFGQRLVAAVSSVFGSLFTLGLGAFSFVWYFLLVISGCGCKRFAGAAAFPAHPSNPALNPTCAKSRAVGLAPRWAWVHHHSRKHLSPCFVGSVRHPASTDFFSTVHVSANCVSPVSAIILAFTNLQVSQRAVSAYRPVGQLPPSRLDIN